MASKVTAILAAPVDWAKAVQKNMSIAQDKIGDEMLKMAKGTTATWSDKPKFTVEKRPFTVSRPLVRVSVTTDDKRWLWTDEGTKPHIIRPKRAKRLVFPSQFRPKTRPGSLKSGRGFKGGPPVFAQEVHHPGTEARGFTPLILKKTGPKARKLWAEALRGTAADWNKAAGG